MSVPEDDFGNVCCSGPRTQPVPVVDYHTDYDNGDSHSSLELFRESPARYAAIRVFRTMQPEPSTAASKIGRALHALLLEYDKECRFEVTKRRRPTLARDFWGLSLQPEKSKTPITPQEVQLVWNLMLAIAAEPDAWNLLLTQQGLNEHILTARDRGDGMLLKCKPDRVLQNGLVVDLKTVDGSVDPTSWSRCLSKWGYHRQAAFYLDVLRGAGQDVDHFVFVAVSKTPPHEVGIYLIDEDSIEQGRRESRVLLDALEECRRTGVWKHEWQGKILTVGVPRWAIDRTS